MPMDVPPRFLDDEGGRPGARARGRAPGVRPCVRASGLLATLGMLEKWLDEVCSHPALRSESAWDGTLAAATYWTTLVTAAWLLLVVAAPRRRELDCLDPLILVCLPCTAFLWFSHVLRMVETQVVPGF